MAKALFSPQSVADLDEIWKYIANELKNPTAADDIVTGITDAVEGLENFPQMGARLKMPYGWQTSYRYVIYKNYMAFYRFENNNVYVDRVLFGRTDYLKQLIENIDI